MSGAEPGGPIPIPNPISQPYWDGTAIGELRLRECNACGAHFRFIRELCPKCWSDDLGWTVSAGKGRIVALCRRAGRTGRRRDDDEQYCRMRS